MMKSNLTDDQVLDFFKGKWDQIQKVKQIVKEFDSEYIEHTRIREKPETLSLTVVMTTTPRRRQQTLFTLKTIKNSKISHQVQVVIVEDSNSGGTCIPQEMLEEIGLFIDHVIIRNKFWINPCVNYNIGFRLALSDKIIIQNGEVCHVGDICLKANSEVIPGKYIVFDVIALKRPELNSTLHNRGITPFCRTRGNLNPRNAAWYQHHRQRNANLHFLTAISSKDLEKIGGGFDLDYSMATCFDDPAFINQLKSIDIKFVNIPESGYSLLGIHQWHGPENPKMTLTNVHNQHLLTAKSNYCKKNNGEYPFLETESALESLFKKNLQNN